MEVTGFGRKVVAGIENNPTGGVILEIEEGKKTDLAFHLMVEKVVYVLKGNVVAWVLRDGKMASLTLGPNTSFFVRAGLVHQYEAVDQAIVIEFLSDKSVYLEDVSVIAKGTPLPEPEPEVADGEFVKAEPDVEPVKKVAVKKKTPTRKKKTTAKKKTSGRKKKTRK